MALVRRTQKLFEALEDQIQDIMYQKIRTYLVSTKIMDLIEKFITTGWEANAILIPDDREWVESKSPTEINNFASINPIKLRLHLLMPEQESHYKEGYCQEMTVQKQSSIICPALVIPKMVYFDPGYRICCGLSTEEGYNESFKDGPIFRMTIKIPRHTPTLVSGGVGNYEFTTVGKPGKKTDQGEWEHVMDQNQHKRSKPLKMNEEQDKVDFELVKQFLAFNEVLEGIDRIVERYYKTRKYIFGELFQLPSLNKMVDYFPGIQAFLDEELTERLNKGMAKKKQYQVALPDQEVIVSATEANIK